MKTKKRLIFVVLLLVLTLLACATANPLKGVPLGLTGEVYGFWNGLWDGFTAPLTFLANLFGGHWGIYEVHNNGNWYDFGFLLGLGIWGSGVSVSNRRSG